MSPLFLLIGLGVWLATRPKKSEAPPAPATPGSPAWPIEGRTGEGAGGNNDAGPPRPSH